MMDRQTALDTVAEALAGARARRGLSLEDAATAAQVDLERLASAESGEDALTDPELEALAATYDCDVAAFFGGRTTPISYLFGA